MNLHFLLYDSAEEKASSIRAEVTDYIRLRSSILGRNKTKTDEEEAVRLHI